MKIVCICGNGLGSSFLLEMNVKAVVKDLGFDFDIDHSDIGSAYQGMADLIVCASDLYDNCTRFGEAIGLNNIMDKNELKEKLETFLESRK